MLQTPSSSSAATPQDSDATGSDVGGGHARGRPRGLTPLRTVIAPDADADGLTDVKEVELGSDAGEETVFFLKDAYDFAVNTSRLAGQADVTDAPAFFELFTTPQYDAIVADRDSRFVDSDADGLTDVKEDELETNADEETIFYLAEAYDTIVADRDSRFVDADADGLTDVKEVELGSDAGEETVFFLKDAYDFAVNISRLAGQADVTDAPAFFELFTTPQYEAIVADRNSRFVDSDADGSPTSKKMSLRPTQTRRRSSILLRLTTQLLRTVIRASLMPTLTGSRT